MCRSFVLWFPTALGILAVVVAATESGSSNYETVRNSNAAILNRLGLVPVRIPDGHHKKRLAGPEPESGGGSGLVAADNRMRIHQPYSRRHGNRDSHVYIVKLPASQPYYSLTKPHKPSDAEDKITKKTTLTTTTRLGPAAAAGPQVGFHSNGKPNGKIYHWNLPMVKKMNEKKRLHAQLRIEQMRRKLEAEMNDQQAHRRQQQQQHHRQGPLQGLQSVDLPNGHEKPLAPVPLVKLPSSDFNSKRYHHHSASGNALHRDDKPAKHVRNNDKRLNYPRVAEELRKAGRPEKLQKFTSGTSNATSQKTYRLEGDSSLYRLGVGGLDANDRRRLAAWKLGNELHASGSSSSHAPKPKKHRKKAAMSYYAPISASVKQAAAAAAAGPTSIQKNFPGNGKPKAFYVMEKSRQPVYYHPLLP